MELCCMWFKQYKKRKTDVKQISQEKTIFMNKLKLVEKKILCVVLDVYKNFDGDKVKEFFEVLSRKKEEIEN